MEFYILGVAAFIMIIELTDPRLFIVVVACWVMGLGLSEHRKYQTGVSYIISLSLR